MMVCAVCTIESAVQLPCAQHENENECQSEECNLKRWDWRGASEEYPVTLFLEGRMSPFKFSNKALSL